MYSASPRFFEAIQDSHIVVVKVEVYNSIGEIILDYFDKIYGNVSVDRKVATRRTGSITLADASGILTPRDASDVFHPLASNYIKVYRGVKFGTNLIPETRTRLRLVDTEGVDEPLTPTITLPPGNYTYNTGSDVVTATFVSTDTYVEEEYIVYLEEDDVEFIPQGVFDIFDANVEDTVDELRVQLKLFDFSRKVERARLLSNYTIAAGTNYGTAIHDIIDGGVSGLNYLFPAISYITPKIVFGASGDQEGGDRWKYAREMADSIGHELYFDREGNVRLDPVAIEKNQPIVWHYAEGERAMLIYVNRSLSKEDTYNHVIAVGESTSNDEPVKGEATDDDPNSPTYIGSPYGTGPYGAVPFFLRSKFIRTISQANQAAAAKLQQVTGTTEQMRVMTTVNPAHDAGDRVRITRQRSKVDSEFVIDNFNIPLEYSGGMNLVMRETRRA